MGEIRFFITRLHWLLMLTLSVSISASAQQRKPDYSSRPPARIFKIDQPVKIRFDREMIQRAVRDMVADFIPGQLHHKNFEYMQKIDFSIESFNEPQIDINYSSNNDIVVDCLIPMMIRVVLSRGFLESDTVVSGALSFYSVARPFYVERKIRFKTSTHMTVEVSQDIGPYSVSNSPTLNNPAIKEAFAERFRETISHAIDIDNQLAVSVQEYCRATGAKVLPGAAGNALGNFEPTERNLIANTTLKGALLFGAFAADTVSAAGDAVVKHDATTLPYVLNVTTGELDQAMTANLRREFFVHGKKQKIKYESAQLIFRDSSTFIKVISPNFKFPLILQTELKLDSSGKILLVSRSFTADTQTLLAKFKSMDLFGLLSNALLYPDISAQSDLTDSRIRFLPSTSEPKKVYATRSGKSSCLLVDVSVPISMAKEYVITSDN
jgi:hypothetical protein